MTMVGVHRFRGRIDDMRRELDEVEKILATHPTSKRRIATSYWRIARTCPSMPANTSRPAPPPSRRWRWRKPSFGERDPRTLRRPCCWPNPMNTPRSRRSSRCRPRCAPSSSPNPFTARTRASALHHRARGLWTRAGQCRAARRRHSSNCRPRCAHAIAVYGADELLGWACSTRTSRDTSCAWAGSTRPSPISTRRSPSSARMRSATRSPT